MDNTFDEGALGFISPDGTIHSCEFFGHRSKAVEIIENITGEPFYGSLPDEKLHKAGWATIYRDSTGKRKVSNTRKLTSAQIRTIKSELLWTEDLKAFQMYLVHKNEPIVPLI